MRLPLVLTMLAATTAACTGTGAVGGEASCVVSVRWEGTTYTGGAERLYESVGFGQPLGKGVIPACNDHSGSDDVDSAVTIVGVKGVDPRIAIGYAGSDQPMFAPGYVVASPAHPLHDAVYRRGFDATADMRCRNPRTIAGILRNTPGFANAILVRGLNDVSDSFLRQYDHHITVGQNTEFEDLDRDGIPYLEEGTELSLVVQPCKNAEGGRELVATRISKMP